MKSVIFLGLTLLGAEEVGDVEERALEAEEGTF